MKLGKKRNGTGNFFAWPIFFLVLVQMNLTSKYKSFITSYLIYSLFLCFLMFSNQTQGHHRSTRYYRHPHIRPRFHMRPHRHASRKKKHFIRKLKINRKKSYDSLAKFVFLGKYFWKWFSFRVRGFVADRFYKKSKGRVGTSGLGFLADACEFLHSLWLYSDGMAMELRGISIINNEN